MRTSVLLAALVLGLSQSVHAATTPGRTEDRQARNIYELIYSMHHAFSQMLSPEELRIVMTRNPEEIRETHPELYRRISQRVKVWTQRWIEHVQNTYVPIAEKRLIAAQQASIRVDDILKSHFEARGWKYRRLEAVFLPPRVFLDEAHRDVWTSGVYIPFYPDAFFVSVDWPVPMELLLVHEALHFNRIGSHFGHEMSEGITEAGARYLVLEYELLKPSAVRRAPAYPREVEVVEMVLEEMMKRASKSRDEALEIFLAAYVTGNQDQMSEIFGAEAWARVVEVSQSERGWQTHKVKAALAGSEK